MFIPLKFKVTGVKGSPPDLRLKIQVTRIFQLVSRYRYKLIFCKKKFLFIENLLMLHTAKTRWHKNGTCTVHECAPKKASIQRTEKSTALKKTSEFPRGDVKRNYQPHPFSCKFLQTTIICTRDFSTRRIRIMRWHFKETNSSLGDESYSRDINSKAQQAPVANDIHNWIKVWRNGSARILINKRV